MNYSYLKYLPRDLTAGLVVFLVALPLCLGVALASNAPLFSGIIAGVVGGLIVGTISGSHTSVSGPSAGSTAVVVAQIATLGSFEAFLTAVVLAGVIQIILGSIKAGFIASFFPSNVIKGLLAAIGVILILKQIPHALGYDTDPMGHESFHQAGSTNTFSSLVETWFNIQPGATLVGLLSVGLLLAWDRITWLKKSPVPAPLIVVAMGITTSMLLQNAGGHWAIDPSHLVQVPIADSITTLLGFLNRPNLSVWSNPDLYMAAVTIALVTSLETLLNLEAVDKIDPERRTSPPNRELIAQGIGNMVTGLIGGLPISSVIVRSSTNINAGVKTKLGTVFHGLLLMGCVALIPSLLNKIPLSALAGILLVTGLKLASPKLVKQMWREGRPQFLPFIVTVVAIVMTNLLAGILIGLSVAVFFILQSNMRRPMKKIMERHAAGDEVLRVELANQVSFLSRAALETTLREVPRGGHVLLDASETDYMDPDILDLITDFKTSTADAHGVQVSLVGFKDRYPQLQDRIRYVDYSSRDVQSGMTPLRVLEILHEGNQRFLNGTRLVRDLGRQVGATSTGQFPMAVVLSCIDSRAPAELIFDLGLGDIFSVRIAGNIARDKVLGSMEYACAVAGAKLVLVMGHTSCGAVNAAVDLISSHKTVGEATGCVNLSSLITEIQQSVDRAACERSDTWSPAEKAAYANEVSRRNVLRTMRMVRERSTTLDKLVNDGKIAVVGAMYDIATGEISFFQTPESSFEKLPIPMISAV